MIPLKHNFCFIVANDQGAVADDTHASGAFFFDTRMLSRYQWVLPNFKLLKTVFDGSRGFTQYWSHFEDHKQTLLVERTLTVNSHGFTDHLVIYNDDIDDHTFPVKIDLDSDFVDMFELRNASLKSIERTIEKHLDTQQYQASYRATDDLKFSVSLTIDGAHFDEVISLKARQQTSVVVNAKFVSDLDNQMTDINEPRTWLDSGSVTDPNGIYKQAELDLHDLLLSTPEGLTIAAGIPWFVTPFGRDSLITAWFLLEKAPQLAKGVLHYLAEHQGSQIDAFRDEEPGKIMHELRLGEYSRLGILPFKTYYGTADATPLFLMLLHDYCQQTQTTDLVTSLKTSWESALTWLNNFRDERGLIVFSANSNGLIVQSWKDSNDSLSYADGSLGSGKLAVAEVQGYAYAAFKAAAYFYEVLGNTEKSAHYEEQAEQLRATFIALFWMPHHSNFAIALDEQDKKLDINSSDTGHLLWSGIIPDDMAKSVVDRLFAPDLWSGWGLRTLSTSEKRYNPISYHNGSIWPHDTGIFAAGLKRYGYLDEFTKVKTALYDLATTQDDKRLPELFGGYTRNERPVLPYIEACRPQAWSAAALIYLMSSK